MNTIEPPVLVSRIMTFVFVAAVITVVVLAATLVNLLPLQRTQVFFLTTQPRANTEIILQNYAINANNMEILRESFIREYIKTRNEVIPTIRVMQNRWGTGDGGRVHIWSTPDVFSGFINTGMWQAISSADTDLDWRCRVEFTRPIVPYGAPPANQNAVHLYLVSFRYFCFNDFEETPGRDYQVVIGIEFQPHIQWSRRLENPLGLVVSEYRIVYGGNDPLDQFGI